MALSLARQQANTCWSALRCKCAVRINPFYGPLLAIVNCHDIAFKEAAKRFVARMRHGHDASMP